MQLSCLTLTDHRCHQTSKRGTKLPVAASLICTGARRNLATPGTNQGARITRFDSAMRAGGIQDESGPLRAVHLSRRKWTALSGPLSTCHAISGPP